MHGHVQAGGRRVRVVALVLAACVLTALASPAAAQVSRGERDRARDKLAAAREAAVEQVLASSRSDSPTMRANAIEAATSAPEHAAELIDRGLNDENPGVRFSALLAAGQLELDRFGETAERLAREPDISPAVRGAALYAAARGGRDVDLSPLAGMLASQDSHVRANAALLLKMLGDASAVPMLEELAHAPMPRASAVRHAIVRVQIAEAMVTLGEDAALDALRGGVYSHHDEVRVLAVQALGRVGDEGMAPALERLVRGDEPIELRLAAAEALGRLGMAGEHALRAARRGAGWDERVIRAQAAFTLARLPHVAAAERAVELLHDDASEQVRLSAAAAVLRALE